MGMLNWLYGKELLERTGLKDFELFRLKDKGLIPHDELGKPILPPDFHKKEALLNERKEKLRFLEMELDFLQKEISVSPISDDEFIREFQSLKKRLRDKKKKEFESLKSNPLFSHLSERRLFTDPDDFPALDPEFLAFYDQHSYRFRLGEASGEIEEIRGEIALLVEEISGDPSSLWLNYNLPDPEEEALKVINDFIQSLFSANTSFLSGIFLPTKQYSPLVPFSEAKWGVTGLFP